MLQFELARALNMHIRKFPPTLIVKNPILRKGVQLEELRVFSLPVDKEDLPQSYNILGGRSIRRPKTISKHQKSISFLHLLKSFNHLTWCYIMENCFKPRMRCWNCNKKLRVPFWRPISIMWSWSTLSTLRDCVSCFAKRCSIFWNSDFFFCSFLPFIRLFCK